MKLKAYILEDELLAVNRLKRLLQEVAPDINVLHSYETIEDLAKALKEDVQPDILFLDIQVADGNSMELFKLVKVESKVIFISAYDKYAIEAFRNSATDYLLKPIKKDQLIEAIAKAKSVSREELSFHESPYNKSFLIKFGSKLKHLKVKELAYIYSKNKISYFVSKGGDRFPSDYKLNELESLLDPKYFIRANRQFIIHIDSISTMHRHEASRIKLTLIPEIDQEIIISTERTKTFKAWLKNN